VLKHGGGYETWEERLNFAAWQAAIEETRYPLEELFSERTETERFSWDHIDAQVSRSALLKEWLQAREGIYTPDCRTGVCNLCGAQRHTPACCEAMRKRHSITLETGPPPAERIPEPVQTAPPGVQRLRFRTGRTGRLRFLSHLETVQAWIRALRRAGIPLAFSQGFHAHPKVTFSTAQPLGEESEAEFMDCILEAFLAPEEALAALRKTLPDGLHAYECREVVLNAPSLMAAVTGFSYLLVFEDFPADLNERIERINAAATLPLERMVKNHHASAGPPRKPVTVDIRPLITELARIPVPEGYTGTVHHEPYGSPINDEMECGSQGQSRLASLACDSPCVPQIFRANIFSGQAACVSPPACWKTGWQNPGKSLPCWDSTR